MRAAWKASAMIHPTASVCKARRVPPQRVYAQAALDLPIPMLCAPTTEPFDS